VAVTKGVPAAHMRAAYAAGLRHLGENRIQEARPKIAALADLADVTWHLVGHLQTNKAKDAVELFHVVHSADSERIVDALERRCAMAGRSLDVFLEVNVAGEAAKYGTTVTDVTALARRLQQCPHLTWVGLMTVAPLADEAEAVRPVFRQLHALREQLQEATGSPLKLSMGMSNDFHIAIEEGADIVRVGSAIFQESFWKK